MKTFGELLSQHMRRAGVSDAEMARTLGVQRQTIFRWREGTVQRPREREDLLRIAGKLRLTPAERDELLLAAGFAPEVAIVASPPQVVEPVGDQAPQAVSHTLTSGLALAQSLEDEMPRPPLAAAPTPVRRRRVRLWLMVGVVVVLTLAGLATVLIHRPDQPGQVAAGLDWPQPAQPDETLVLLSQFANYSQGQAGFNVAGRLQEALQEEVATAALDDVRIAIWPAVIDSPDAALKATQATSATLVLWGEYDSGRVVAHVQAPGDVEQQEVRRLVESPADLNVTVNTELPKEMRWVALYVLGEATMSAGRYATADAALQRALSMVGGNDEVSRRIYYDLGFIESAKSTPDFSQAIAYYTMAIERAAGSVSAFNNRGVCYSERRSEGDLPRAVEDFQQAIRLDPDSGPSQFNLGLVLLAQGGSEQEPAMIALRRAYELAPDAAGTNNALCWGYALQASPEDALPYCDRAVALDPTLLSRDSRGVVYALLGRNAAAITEFESFMTWLREQPQATYDRYAPKRQAWIEALRQGRNPFDAATLESLRSE